MPRAAKTVHAKRNGPRGTTAERGYGAAWRRLRLYIIARDPVCCICKAHHSEHVDHIRPKTAGGTDATDNLQGLCATCHMTKTKGER